jgi:hypothetical protein
VVGRRASIYLPPLEAYEQVVMRVYPNCRSRADRAAGYHRNFSSCIASVRCRVTDAHSSNQLGCHAFGIEHRFVCRYVEIEVLFVDPTEGSQVGAERRTGPLTGVAVDLASAVPIIISGPFVDPMTDGGMGWMAPMVTLPFIGVEDRALPRDILCDAVSTCALVRMVTYPKTLLPCVPRDDADDRWTIVGVGPMPFPLVGTPPGRIRGVEMRRTFFPRRFGTVRPPQRRCRSSRRSARSHSNGLGCAAARYGAACVRGLAHAPGVPWARLWRCRAAPARGWPGAAGFSQRPSRSAVYSTPHRPDTGRPESVPVRGTGAVRRAHSAGIQIPGGGAIVPAKEYRCYRPSARQSGNPSCDQNSTFRTVITHEPGPILKMKAFVSLDASR